MAEFAIDIISASPLLWTEGFHSTEKGRLKSIAIQAPGGGTAQGMIYCVAGAMSGGSGTPYIKAVFFEGYVSETEYGHWEGDYPLEAGDRLFFRARSIITFTLRLAGRIDIGDP